MSIPPAYHRETIQPSLAVTENDAKRQALAAYAREGGGPAIKAVAAHFGIPGGRKWPDLNMREVDTLWKHTLGGEPLPAAVDEAGVWTPDDSPEGIALNSRIPF